MDEENIKMYGLLAVVIILLTVTGLSNYSDNIDDSQINETYADIYVQHMFRVNAVADKSIPITAEGYANYCWTEFIGADGLGFGARIWNFTVSELSDCEILEQECRHFENVSESFICRWQTNTCTCHINKTYVVDNYE